MAEHTSETIAEAIRPTLDAFVASAEPACRKAADDILILWLSEDEPEPFALPTPAEKQAA